MFLCSTMPKRRRPVELIRARALSPSVRSLVFGLDEPLAFEAGQYVDVFAKVASGFVFKRPYSIASVPADAREIEIAVTLVQGGPMSTALHAMQPGERAEIEGPSGVFRMRGAREEPALFVATGSGLAPLRSMLAEDLARGAGGGERALLFGVRAEKDILWRNELDASARQHGRFRFEPTLSRPDAGWTGRTGYVQRHLAEMLASLGGAPRVHVYVCGLSRMTDEVTAMLEQDLGVPHERVNHETYD
jgi:CDP-4-dehydro-6-deoxyglucose reductase